MAPALTRHAYRESGLQALWATGSDAWLIIISRCCRMFAYGACSLILALFFAEIGVSDSRIGLFMTLTLGGDVLLSLFFSLIADQVGRRRTLLAGSVLMVISGAVFALSENYWLLLLAAVVGVISATGSDFGPFRAIEESMLSELTTPSTRADVLVWYVTTASLGSAAGFEAAGQAVEWLRSRDGWTLANAYHTCFWLYSIMGGVNLLLSLLLSKKCELKRTARAEGAGQEAESMLQDGEDEEDLQLPKPKGTWYSQISSETRRVMYALWFLLVVDSLADGMVGMSLTTYYMDKKFHMSKSFLGNILSTSYLLAGISTIFSATLSRHLGLVNTMVFTHVPSSTAVLLFPAAQSVPFMCALLLVRIGLNNMDQAPRSALIAAVVKAEERTTVMGITSMLRTLAATTGPTVTGFLAGSDRFWIAFVVAGALRLAYDMGLFVMFINIKLYKHEQGVVDEQVTLKQLFDLSQIPAFSVPQFTVNLRSNADMSTSSTTVNMVGSPVLSSPILGKFSDCPNRRTQNSSAHHSASFDVDVLALLPSAGSDFEFDLMDASATAVPAPLNIARVHETGQAASSGEFTTDNIEDWLETENDMDTEIGFGPMDDSQADIPAPLNLSKLRRIRRVRKAKYAPAAEESTGPPAREQTPETRLEPDESNIIQRHGTLTQRQRVHRPVRSTPLKVMVCYADPTEYVAQTAEMGVVTPLSETFTPGPVSPIPSPLPLTPRLTHNPKLGVRRLQRTTTVDNLTAQFEQGVSLTARVPVPCPTPSKRPVLQRGVVAGICKKFEFE